MQSLNRKTWERNRQWIIRDKYGEDSRKFSKKDKERLDSEEPADYIIGWVPFLDVSIDLSKRPLIPRPETEHWVKQAREEIEARTGSRNAKFSALDIFAGSGCIGAAILKHFPNARMDFADVDRKAIAQIKINLKKNGVGGRSHVLYSDKFKKIKNTYDYIFANPPYINEKDFKKLPHSVKAFEPEKALFGGKGGLVFIKKILAEAGNFLNNGGVLYMEFGSGQKKAIEKIIKQAEWRETAFCKDQYSKWRWFRCVK